MQVIKKAKALLALAAMLFALGAFAACGSTQNAVNEAPPQAPGESMQTEVAEPPPRATRITWAQAYAMMQEETPFLLIDVREASEFSDGHVIGAVHLPLAEIAAASDMSLLEDEGRILLYCRSGRRSAEAAALLIALGYRQVYDFGGINDVPGAHITP